MRTAAGQFTGGHHKDVIQQAEEMAHLGFHLLHVSAIADTHPHQLPFLRIRHARPLTFIIASIIAILRTRAVTAPHAAEKEKHRHKKDQQQHGACDFRTGSVTPYGSRKQYCPQSEGYGVAS
jgi:hypothetical protein